MLSSIQFKILNNKLNLLKREINYLTIWCFLEQSVKDILFYHQNFNDNIFYKISKNREIFDIFYFLKNNKDSITISFERIKKILIFFKIYNDFSNTELEELKKIFQKRNVFAHENKMINIFNYRNTKIEDRKDFFVIFKIINLLLIKTNKIFSIKK